MCVYDYMWHYIHMDGLMDGQLTHPFGVVQKQHVLHERHSTLL